MLRRDNDYKFMLKKIFYRKSFEKIFKDNYTRLYIYAIHIINNEEFSRDIVSDVFTKLWEDFEKINQETIKAYLTQCVRNKCLDHLRHLTVSDQYTKEYISKADEFYNDYNEKVEQDILIAQMLNSLPPLTKKILEECYLNQKKYKEVAQEMNISPDTVKKHISKALRLLRESYGIYNLDELINIPDFRVETYN